MALVFIDGFDHLGSSIETYLLRKWDGGGASFSADVHNGTVRTGTGALRISNGLAEMMKLLPPGDVFIVGAAIRFTAYATVDVIALREGASTTHIGVSFTAGGFLTVRRGATLLATATSHAFALNTWYYIEVKVVIHDSAGSVAVRVETVPVTFDASLTGIDTRNGGTGNADRLILNGNATTFFDDLYVCDDSGTVNNDFLGVCAVETLLPSSGAAGTHQDFTPSTGTDHGALVDETPPTDDTDYNASSTVNHQDSYNYPSLALPGGILGVQTNLYTRKTDTGARTIAPIVRTGSTTFAGTAVSPLTTYKYFSEVRQINPQTGLAWTAAEIAALEVGLKIVS